MNQEQILKLKSLKFKYNFTTSWGALHIFSEDILTAQKEIKNEVLNFYQSFHLKSVDWQTPLSGELSTEEFNKKLNKFFPDEEVLDLQLFEIKNFSEDEIYIILQSTEGWIAIMSRALEWTLPGENPLASYLSKKWDVLSTTFIEDNYTELTLYRKGVVEGQFLSGPIFKDREVDTMDWNWFDGKGNVTPVSEIQSAASDLELCLDFAGPVARGHREAMSAAPIFDYGPESYLVLRSNLN